MTEYSSAPPTWQPVDGATATGQANGTTKDKAAEAAQNSKQAAVDVAQQSKQAAVDVAQQGKQAASDVAQTAKGAAQDVAQETKQQASDLIGKTRDQVSEQALTQKDAVVESLRSLGDQLAAMTDKADQDGTAIDLITRAKDRTRTAADWLDSREPAEVLDGLRTVGRENPGKFLLGALVAGVAAGRLTRGVAAVHGADHLSTSLTGSSDSPTTAAVTEPRHGNGAVADTPSFGRPVADSTVPVGYQPGGLST